MVVSFSSYIYWWATQGTVNGSLAFTLLGLWFADRILVVLLSLLLFCYYCYRTVIIMDSKRSKRDSEHTSSLRELVDAFSERLFRLLWFSRPIQLQLNAQLHRRRLTSSLPLFSTSILRLPCNDGIPSFSSLLFYNKSTCEFDENERTSTPLLIP